jgi:hypothetical protein
VTASTPIAPDAALPQRDLLLDPEVVRESLERRLGCAGRRLSIESCERLRVKYEIGKSLRTVHRIGIDGAEVVVASRTFPGRSAEAFRRAVAASPAGANLRPVALDEGLETVFWTFPNDRKLKRLARVIEARFVGGLIGREVARTELVAYRPEKAATLRCVGADGSVIGYAKVYADDSGAQVAGVHDALALRLGKAHPRLVVPRLLAYDPSERMLVLEAMNGSTVAELTGREAIDAHARLGAGLAALHALRPLTAPRFSGHDLKSLRTAGGVIERACPGVAALVHRLLSALEAGLPSPGGESVCLHGDLHPKNALAMGRRIALVDFDQVSLGPAAADLGGLVAGLRYSRLIGRLTSETAGQLEGAALAGYAGERDLPPRGVLHWHAAAALLSERAQRSVSRVRPEGLAVVGRILSEGLELLEDVT